MSVGWIIQRKGFDLIPEIAEQVFSKNEDWQWLIIGKGPEENALKEEIRIRGLEEKIIICHPVHHLLDEYYKDASIYVLTSRSEGFPNVLLEAMSFATPCVAFDCMSGPSDIIKQNENGFLIEPEDTHSMASAIELLMKDEQRRNDMGIKAREHMRNFAPEVIYSLWKDLFSTAGTKD